MKERPILFSGAMVRALIEGKKTQTRRATKFPDSTTAVRWVRDHEMEPAGRYTGWALECDAPFLLPRTCPYGVPGDKLWVRETAMMRSVGPARNEISIVFRAEHGEMGGRILDHMVQPGEKNPFRGSSWTPGIHMPRWASRISLLVTGIRVERLQEISEEDSKAEGVLPMYPPGNGPARCRYAYRELWDSLNEKRGYGWATNPWVWVVEFKREGM